MLFIKKLSAVNEDKNVVPVSVDTRAEVGVSGWEADAQESIRGLGRQ